MEIRSETGIQLLSRLLPKDSRVLPISSLPLLNGAVVPRDIVELATEANSPYEEILYGLVAELLCDRSDTQVVFIDAATSFSVFRLINKIERPGGANSKRDWDKSVTHSQLSRLHVFKPSSDDDFLQLPADLETLVLTIRAPLVVVVNEISFLYWNELKFSGRSLLSRFLEGLVRVVRTHQLIAFVCRLGTKKSLEPTNNVSVVGSILSCPFCPDSEFYSVMPGDWQRSVTKSILMRYCFHKRVGKFVRSSGNGVETVDYRVENRSLIIGAASPN